MGHKDKLHQASVLQLTEYAVSLANYLGCAAVVKASTAAKSGSITVKASFLVIVAEVILLHDSFPQESLMMVWPAWSLPALHIHQAISRISCFALCCVAEALLLLSKGFSQRQRYQRHAKKFMIRKTKCVIIPSTSCAPILAT